MIDFIFIAIIGAAFVAYAMKRAFFTSFHDKCYEVMESRGHAVFGMCSGQTGGDYACSFMKGGYYG